MEKVRTFCLNLYKKKTLNNDCTDFLIKNPKIVEASKNVIEADLTLEEFYITFRKMKALEPDGILYSVYHKLWNHAQRLIISCWRYSIHKS
jgi:hypothetical protein